MRACWAPLNSRIISFYNQYVMADTRLVLGLLGALLLLAITYLLSNQFGMDYSGFLYVPKLWLCLTPIALGLMCYAMTVRQESPRLSFFTEIYTLYFVMAVAFTVMETAVQYTPMPRIDHTLLHMDQSMGFSTVGLLQWTAAHPLIKKIFETAYDFLNVEIFIVPLLLTFFNGNTRKRVYHFLASMVIAFLIATTIYYFFPTAAPASILHSRYFLTNEHATYLKYFEIHHYQAVTTGNGGMISFPSCHVIWSILLCYPFRDKKMWLIPVAIINAVVILSTMFLGWHYLMDVVAGTLVASTALFLAHRLQLK